jgi:hypothetical protein
MSSLTNSLILVIMKDIVEMDQEEFNISQQSIFDLRHVHPVVYRN